jgi:hypothetical protein
MFPDYTSIFTSPTFGTSSSINAFQGGSTSFLKNGSSGGGSKLDPFSMAMAGIGGIGSAVGGIFGSQAASRAAYQNAIMAGAGLQYKQAEALGSLGQARWNPLFAATTGGDLSIAREKEAEKFKQFFTRPQDMLYGSETLERANIGRTTQAARKAAELDESLARRRLAAGQLAGPTGMFGPTAFSKQIFG